ncbi:MAG: hypothetical protein H6712_26360 [Myxococcales bacterium]|nr:hypothetical protein [Myxococcales bacterium]MCB9717399.1 hypothetical protein [Myxococcales bacterium]
MTEHLARPLERLSDAVQTFVSQPELRALVVAVDEHLRSAALRVMLAGEHSARNHSPWLCLQVPGSSADWGALEAALRREHARMREVGAPLKELATDVAGSGAGRFAAWLRHAEGTVREPAAGLVAVLVCQASRLDAEWLRHLGEMILDPVLEGVRFVVQLSTCATAWTWAQSLPAERCLVHRCVVDPKEAADALAKEIDNEERGGPEGTWPAGVAPPTERGGELTSPPRDPTRKDDGPQRPTGLAEPAEPIETDAICVKRAVLAMGRGDGAEAVRQQARARDLCVRDGRLEDAVRMELVLGGYMLDLGETRQSQASFDRAARMSSEIPAPGLEAQARYAEAHTWREQRQVDSMMRSYWDGIDAAKRGDEPRLAFEGYWEAGRVLQPLDRKSTLVSLWSDAIAYANTIEPAQRKGTKLPQIVEGLADVLRSMRRPADARAVEEWGEDALGDTDATDSPADAPVPTSSS